MTNNFKLTIAMLVIALSSVIVIVVVSSGNSDAEKATKTPAERDERLVRDDSPRLSKGTKATFVEFLDFECEACGALYPTIEDLKDKYGEEVTFVIRYMPLHTSSVNAAKAAEAAGVQNKYKEMFDILFQRQSDWGHKDKAEEQKFFDYAQELGLDMTKFREDFSSDAIKERINQSEADGKALGVTGTPTMFMDGKKLDPQSLDDLVAEFEAAVEK